MHLAAPLALFIDDRAVTPVVGVVLMTAIAVSIATIAGTVVFDDSERIDTTPEATFEYEHTSGEPFVVTHTGGAAFDRLEVFVDGVKVDDWSGPVRRGASFTSPSACDSGSVVIVWTDARSGRTAVVSTYDL